MNNYPETKATRTWKNGSLTYSLVLGDEPFMHHYCGYARFPKRPVREVGYYGILSYVPVHGGITYARQDDEGMVYGFDCAHAGDEEKSWLKDEAWLMAECERMAFAIQWARWFELPYRMAWSNNLKAKVIGGYHALLRRRGIEFELTDNFGAMLNLLAGDL